jgi:hypothetical protein
VTSLLDAIEQVCRETHFPLVQAVFGDSGVEAVFQIMETARHLYRNIDLERVDGEIVIYRRLAGAGAGGPPYPPGVPLAFGSMATLSITDLVIELGADGRPYPASLGAGTVEQLAESAVVYRYHAGSEEFLAGSQRRSVIKLDPSSRSQFSVPTFSNLREALQNYAVENVRESTCYIFKDTWFDRQRRLFFKAGPEEAMRRSLAQFLKNRLGVDHDVWEEQVVDDSHPVDIRVTPRFSNNRLMLIEIKWLGWSAAPDGHITARHGEGRAQEGANQLAGYLEAQRQSAPTSVVQGYYVIIDARRRNLHEGDVTISRADGMYFENEEIIFSPAHHSTRRDFDPPYRMFARPICGN